MWERKEVRKGRNGRRGRIRVWWSVDRDRKRVQRKVKIQFREMKGWREIGRRQGIEEDVSSNMMKVTGHWWAVSGTRKRLKRTTLRQLKGGEMRTTKETQNTRKGK